MKIKQMVCKACGCAFEVKSDKETGAGAGKTAQQKESDKDLAPCCPECKSYDVQTA